MTQKDRKKKSNDNSTEKTNKTKESEINININNKEVFTYIYLSNEHIKKIYENNYYYNNNFQLTSKNKFNNSVFKCLFIDKINKKIILEFIRDATWNPLLFLVKENKKLFGIVEDGFRYLTEDQRKQILIARVRNKEENIYMDYQI